MRSGPPASSARTSSTWSPCASPRRGAGDAQVAHAPASRRQPNEEPAPLARNEWLDVAPTLATGALTKLVSGGESTRKARTAPVRSRLPAASRARTPTVWAPSPRREYDTGDEPGAQARASSRQAKADPVSEAAKLTRAEPDPVTGGGPPVIVVVGASASAGSPSPERKWRSTRSGDSAWAYTAGSSMRPAQ